MSKIKSFMKRLHNPDLGILFLRLAVGIVFIHAGWLKLSDMGMVVKGFASMGMSAGLAYFVAYTELISGIALIIGVLVQYAGVLLSIVMIVAILKVHLPSGYGLQNGGYEYTLLLLLCSLAVITFGGPGKYTLKYFNKGKI